jgi:hypothetical protein
MTENKLGIFISLINDCIVHVQYQGVRKSWRHWQLGPVKGIKLNSLFPHFGGNPHQCAVQIRQFLGALEKGKKH